MLARPLARDILQIRTVVRTHTARDADLAATIDRLRSTDAVRRVVGVMRVEGEDGS